MTYHSLESFDLSQKHANEHLFGNFINDLSDGNFASVLILDVEFDIVCLSRVQTGKSYLGLNSKHRLGARFVKF
jgi:hypothetical protein